MDVPIFRRQRGFTLIEAAVAIAVVAILSGIIVPLVVKNLQDSQNARAKNDIQVIAAAIASELKDTGSRPTKAGTAGSDGTGVTDSNWVSGSGTAPTNVTATSTTNNTFLQIFAGLNGSLAASAPQSLFGTTAGNEFSYKGPYLAADVCQKTDPWGHTYCIFGYNANGQTNNSPIWVVCSGPDGTVNTTANAVSTSAGLPAVWTFSGTSADDIVVRVN